MKNRKRIFSRFLILIMALTIAFGSNTFAITASAKGCYKPYIWINQHHHNKRHHHSHHSHCHKDDTKENSDVNESKYTFNPHACSKKLYDAYGSKYWDTLFKLIDALRAGEDTFECPDEDAYEWCGDIRVLDHYIPVARHNVELEEGNFSDGVGKITYKIPKEEYVQKEKEFEDKLMEIVNTYVRKDDSDLEKCIALFDYFSVNYSFDYERKAEWFDADNELYQQQGFGLYYAFMHNDHVICEEVSGLYNMMLNQCGVDALAYKSEEIRHMWSYVTVDGVGFFVDCNSSLNMTDDEAVLGWFGMTDANCHKAYGDDLAPINLYRDINPDVDFSAPDDRFDKLRFGTLVEMDRERKVLRIRVDDKIGEYNYETDGDLIFDSEPENQDDSDNIDDTEGDTKVSTEVGADENTEVTTDDNTEEETLSIAQ